PPTSRRRWPSPPMPRPTATAPATPCRPCCWMRRWPRRCCRAWRRPMPRTAWSCAAASARGRSAPRRRRPATRAGRPCVWPRASAASEEDWAAEYLAPVLALRVVEGIDDAMAHIERYGSHHTDAIVTEDYALARRFMAEVDSSSVMVNASTRFADGFEYGLGAE